MSNIKGRILTLPCWHTEAHSSLPIFIHQLKCSTREQYEPLSLKGNRHKGHQAAVNHDHLNYYATQRDAYHNCQKVPLKILAFWLS